MPAIKTGRNRSDMYKIGSKNYFSKIIINRSDEFTSNGCKL